MARGRVVRDNDAALVGPEIHAVEATTHKQMALRSFLKVVDFFAKRGQQPGWVPNKPMGVEPFGNALLIGERFSF